MQIYSFDKEKFPFDDVTLANPQGLQGGAFFTSKACYRANTQM